MTDIPRISLAEVARSSPAVLRPGDSDHWQATSAPTLADITECLFFSPGDGRIWLNDQRMVLLHSCALGSLRRELIDSLGIDKARGLLTRAGYVSGARDANLVRERWPDADPPAVFAAGTRLHALEGMVKVEVLHFEFDPEQGRYDGDFIWHHSSEDEEHTAAYGVSTFPACWMQLGYAIGYVSTLIGRLIVFRELSCRAMGDPHCRVLGKSAEQWGDVDEDMYYLNAQSFVNKPIPRRAAVPKTLSTTAAEDVVASADRGDAMLVGASSAFNAACHQLQRVATTDATVLFTGESGVGKEIFATMLHRIGRRQNEPFIAVNCAAIPETLIESELFGVERGAFTGADRSRPGRFERADGGTLFLDEVGTLSMFAQGKLLRVLQEGEIERIGSTQSVRVDVRVVAATNIDLREAVRNGEFRGDLYYRLNVFPIHLPPLRERRDDIPLLMNHFLGHYCAKHSRRVVGFTQRAVKAMLSYEFPGNIREMQNIIERAVILAPEAGSIDVPHLFTTGETLDRSVMSVSLSGDRGVLSPQEETPGPGGCGSPSSLLDHLGQWPSASDALSLPNIEQTLLNEAVSRCDGNLAAAARLLGITRAQLAYRLKA